MDASRLSPALDAALSRARYIYLTTYSNTGKPGTVPTWLWPHAGDVYFTTQRDSLKARRIRDNGRVTVHVGRKDGPAFEGHAGALTEMVVLGCLAVRWGAPIDVDPATGRVLTAIPAEWMQPAFRPGWGI